MANADNTSTKRIVFLYVLFGGLWILFSDSLLGLLVNDPGLMTRIAVVKGWIFIALTAILLRFLVRNRLLELEAANRICRISEEEIRRLNAELEERVAHRTTQLELANSELKSFSYSVSHDLRAPLLHIDAYSRLLLEDDKDRLGTNGVHHLERIRAGVEKMNQLIDDLLSLSQVTSTELRRESVDLSRMAREFISELLKETHDRRFNVNIADDVVVDGDARLLRIVMDNLLGNAFKYTGKKEVSIIEFGCREENGVQALFVRDNGAGFDMGRYDQLFAAFQRLHPESDFPGTGVGLATVQRIIHRHGGQIWAVGSVEQGATFWFTLGTSQGGQS